MKPKNLEFYRMVMGRKPHYIFRQDNKFYVFTDLDNETRGNFSIIDDDEVEKLKKLIIDLRLVDFHPRQLDAYNFEIDREYREQRIRTICYILQAQGFLFQHDFGREIIFERICNDTSYQSFSKYKQEESRNSSKIGKKQKIKNTRKIIGFYIDEYWEKKKKNLVDKNRQPSVFVCSFCNFQKKLNPTNEAIKACPNCKQEII